MARGFYQEIPRKLRFFSKKLKKNQTCTELWYNIGRTLHRDSKKIVINLKVQLMETIRKFIINAAFAALVLTFILFWVCAGIGIQSISIISAFLVFVSAAVLLAASPVSREE